MKGIIKILLTSIITLQSLGCGNQSNSICPFEEYDKHQRHAMLSYVDGNYTASLKSFELAFKVKKDEIANDYFYAAAAALKLNEFSMAEKFIIDAIILKNASKSYYEYFEEFHDYRDIDELKMIQDNYESYQNKYLENQKYPSVDGMLDELKELDQKVRIENYSKTERIQQDSQNVKRLIEITKEFGWQNKSWLILWHQRGTHNEDVYPWNYFRPLIDSLITECKLRPDYWAQYEDQRLMMSEGYQKYGTFWSNYDTYPVKNVALVDERREELGMPPLWYLNKVYHNNLPDGYNAAKIK